MGWIATSGLGGHWLCPEQMETIDYSDMTLLTRGSLWLEADLTPSRRGTVLLDFAQGRPWPVHLRIELGPSGSLFLKITQGGADLRAELKMPEGVLPRGPARIGYAWDGPRKWGQLSLDLPGQGRVVLGETPPPPPLRRADLKALVEGGEPTARHVDVHWMAIADHVAPVGPMPGLAPGTMVASPVGYRAASELRTGDLVFDAAGEVVPVLHVVRAAVPALGSFRPMRLRAPFAGLRRDITVAAHQAVRLAGADIDFMFGRESVLVPAGLLLACGVARPEPAMPVARYVQLVLPGGEPLVAAGLPVESLNVGRLRRNKAALAASLLSDCPRNLMPEHAAGGVPVLDAAQTRVLMAQRAA